MKLYFLLSVVTKTIKKIANLKNKLFINNGILI